MGRGVVIGASAGVGRALSAALASRGVPLVLAARDPRDLDAVCADLRTRFGTAVASAPLDLTAPDAVIETWVATRLREHPDIDTVLVPAGVVADDDDGTSDPAAFDRIVDTNFVGVSKVLRGFLGHIEERGSGTVVLFSSIAVAAPRRRNVAYAAAKAGLESYGRSLQHRFAGTDIRVQIYRLGYVQTSMSNTQDLLLPAASAERVANHVVDRLHTDVRFAYFPRWWRVLVWVLRRMPWAIYRRLDL